MITSKKHGCLGRRLSAWLCQLTAVLGALLALPALADWADPEPIAHHQTWVYTPNAPLPGSTRHGLLVVLHGCAQDAGALKSFGNLTGAAERNGLVLALPDVGWFDQWGIGDPRSPRPECWDYDRALDKQGHVQEVTDLARTLIQRGSLRIDPDHVYVVGLSSGGALSLLLGCAAPDVFAGVGAIAGPSVGSDQGHATDAGAKIPSNNIHHAVETCAHLAAQKNPLCLKTQIANIAFGEMDKDGPKAGYDITKDWWRGHPGQYQVASVEWGVQNVEILKDIYALPGGGQTVALDGATALEWPAGPHARLAEVEVYDVGHAWPSGKEDFGGGFWIARHGLDYPDYIADWFEKHNARAGQPGCHS